MRFSSSAPAAVDADRAYRALRRPELLLPAGGDEESKAPVISGRIGSLAVDYRVRVEVVDKRSDGDPDGGPDRHSAAQSVRYRLRAVEQCGAGDIDGRVTVEIRSGTDGPGGAACTLVVDADLDVRGSVARFGGDAIRAAVDRTTAALATRIAEFATELAVAGGTAQPASPSPTSPPKPDHQPGSPLRTIAMSAGFIVVAAAAWRIVRRIFRHRKAGDNRGLRDD